MADGQERVAASVDCPTCHGAAMVDPDPDCPTCHGEGQVPPGVSLHSHVLSEDFYEQLDPGIRFPVRVLHARGIETHQSCEGGETHAYDRPTIDLPGNISHGQGFAALAALTEYGLRVRDVALLWPVLHGAPSEHFWRITLWQPWPERAAEIPIFEWGYRAR